LQKVVDPRFDPLDAGSFIVFKETLSWLRRLADVRGRRVLVIGTGPAALAFVQVARLEGAAEILVLGRREGRLALARRLGADHALVAGAGELPARIRELTHGEGIEVAIEAAGTVDVLEAVPDCLARGGVLGVYGISAGQAATFRWGWDRPVPRTWSLRFEEPDEAGIHEEASELVSSGRYNLKSTLTHVLPFDQIGEAVELMDGEATGKVAIDFRDGALPG
jgi:threonine dehydrogenase-like Zn-dependent dehydrogenase